ncbi:gypsy type transposase [Tanacetum coccineum]
MHATMVPEQVKIQEIQAGVQVSRPEDTYDIFSIGNALEDVYSIVFVLGRNIVSNSNLGVFGLRFGWILDKFIGVVLGFVDVEYPLGKPIYSCHTVYHRKDIILLFLDVVEADNDNEVKVLVASRMYSESQWVDLWTELCRFSGQKIYPGRGIRFIRSDSQVFLFLNSKCKRYFHNKLKPSKLTWTAMYRKQHKEGDIAQEAVKKRRRATKKPYSRAIVGATLEVIQKKRSEKPEVRDAAREAALREIKERIKKTKDEKKAKKAEVVSKQKTQTKGGNVPKGDPRPSVPGTESDLALRIRTTRWTSRFPCRLLGMSGSEPGEMAPESSKAVVLPKFDMHIYTSELTSEELKTAVNEYCIPMDLHPRLPPPDRRAVPDAMPWRHGDTNLHDDFPTNYDEGEVARMSEFLVPLRPPPRHLLYVCGLTTACRHPELRYDIKDRDMNVIDMDTFLKLPTWTGTVVSRGDPIPEEQRSKPRVTPPLPVGAKLPELTSAQKNLEKPDAKIAAAREKKEQQNLVKAKAKRAGAGGGEGSRKRRKVPKNDESIRSGSEATLSATPLHQAGPEVGKKHVAAAAPEIAKDTPRAEKVIVDLSGNTRVSIPPVEVNQPSPPREHDDTHDPHNLDVHSQSSHHGNEDEPVANSRAYGQSVVAQGELLKRHEQLNRNYVDLRNRNDAQLEELDRLRPGLRRTTQENDDLNQMLTLLDSAHSELEKILSLEKDLEPRTQQLVAAEEKVGVLEGEKVDLLGKVAQAEADRKKLVREFLPAVEDLAWVELRIKLYSSYLRPEIWILRGRMYPDIPPSPVTEGPTSGAAVEDAAQQPPASASKTSTDIPFGTTT